MLFKTILAEKIGETILFDEFHSPVYIQRETFYPIGMTGYWLLMYSGHEWVILRYLSSDAYNV